MRRRYVKMNAFHGRAVLADVWSLLPLCSKTNSQYCRFFGAAHHMPIMPDNPTRKSAWVKSANIDHELPNFHTHFNNLPPTYAAFQPTPA